MKKTGFAIEMLVYTLVVGSFGIGKADWLRYGAMEVFPLQGVMTYNNSEKAIGAEKTGVSKGEDVMDPNSPEARALELGLPTPPDIDINSWEYILVNGENTIDASFEPVTDYAYSSSSESEQDARIVPALNKFASDCEAQGLDVYLSSGYRSYGTQQYLFDLKCEQYDYETAATIVAIPGTSEHQTGLCCDITDYYRDFKNSDLEYTETYKWLYAHCAEYGFILRFPKDKEDITKIIYEPWHFRYVGVEAAKYIMENNLALEEFVPLYESQRKDGTETVESAEEISDENSEENAEESTDVPQMLDMEAI